jgi:hypothetical protein
MMIGYQVIKYGTDLKKIAVVIIIIIIMIIVLMRGCYETWAYDYLCE